MAMSTFQKLTLATCVVLCVALLLPKMLLSRGKKDADRAEGGQGRFPPKVHRQTAGDSQRASGSQIPRAHNTEAIARAKGAGTGAGTGGKSNLAGQIIPIYGFGILLYILYILFKITSKGNSKPTESRFPSIRSENMKRKITDFELAQLQDKLRETEMVMENMVSKANHSPERVKGVSPDQEENLLFQLREITRVMQEGRLVEGVAPEKKAEDDWEDFPAEPQQCWEHSHCPCHHNHQSPPETEAEAERNHQNHQSPPETEAEAERSHHNHQSPPETEAEAERNHHNHQSPPETEAEAERNHHNHQSPPETEAEAERTEADGADGADRADGADLVGNRPLGEMEEEPESLNKDEAAFLTMGDEEEGPRHHLTADNNNDEENSYRAEEGEGEIDLGVPEEDLAGVLEELELTLKMTSVNEQEKVEDLARPAGTTTGATHVRRRNRKKRAKHDLH